MTRRLTIHKLTGSVPEKSSAEFELTFKDSTGATFPPTSIAYTLTDAAGSTTYATGTVTPAATVDIMLKGDDLKLTDGFDGDAEERRLLVEALYNTGSLSNVPLRDSCIFYIKNLSAVT